MVAALGEAPHEALVVYFGHLRLDGGKRATNQPRRFRPSDTPRNSPLQTRGERRHAGHLPEELRGVEARAQVREVEVRRVRAHEERRHRRRRLGSSLSKVLDFVLHDFVKSWQRFRLCRDRIF